ncbi:efflux RND transporter periplasmic adaptor subunit [Flavobacterium selenitireducens]|uniref:efflux RND transporter periplasmic adaptor subunit n=1 Tax=Flavobacterium selenitireducens TaxID=2722704 RepID=UPI00168BC329|nr:efflux RND transporter periplasmic adaptor subunit [Flavobacterium selenitireducens]MBD3581142.1 efflux RND transporter periplasmic adaptor subunit [Flavobacterium selenitireducens]
MKIKYIVYGLLALGIGALVFYRISANKEAKKDDKGPKKAQVVSGIVAQPQDFENNLSLSGSIEANESVDIRSEVSGIVEKIFFNEGTVVSKGQVLFKVNDVELRAQLSKAKTAQQLASENERRAKLLLEKEAISREEYDIASADFKSAKAESQLIQAQLGKTAVRAPFSGKIGLRNISPGTYLTAETIVAKLVNSAEVKITFSVPEKYAPQMKIGSIINFTVAGTTDEFSAKIYAIEPEITVDTRTLRMRALARNPNGRLLPGTFANVGLPLQKIENAIVIPTEAVIPVQDGKKVFVSDGGKAKEVKVETATRTASEILILSGLKAGDTVITTGVMSLKADAPVKVKIQKAAKS